MRIHFLAIGQRIPAWVEEGYQEFARRLPPECRLQLTEIAAVRRAKGADIERLRALEGERLLAALPRDAHAVALDVRGAAWSTEQLAARLAGWMQDGREVALMVGGPDGLAPECLRRADARWSLSALTLPHALVRIVVAEQIYRAWTVYKGHPYHRA
ncbi:MAG: 23S rRNA (pseudouridine(1915)-N(3))-methyltransferase RlmH [Gammaproteobacteria bacterium]|nr:23S rRNA (pseudouridine(1915)-N(3))-methyltransferase RlmH [Gammaproteobacteria bacterium]